MLACNQDNLTRRLAGRRVLYLLLICLFCITGCASNNNDKKSNLIDEKTTTTSTSKNYTTSSTILAKASPVSSTTTTISITKVKDKNSHYPNDVMRAYLKAEKNKDWRTVYKLYPSRTPFTYKEYIKEIIEKSNPTLYEYEVGEFKMISDDIAEVKVSFKEKIDGYMVNGKNEWWRCVKEKDVWKVDWMPRQ